MSDYANAHADLNRRWAHNYEGTFSNYAAHITNSGFARVMLVCASVVANLAVVLSFLFLVSPSFGASERVCFVIVASSG